MTLEEIRPALVANGQDPEKAEAILAAQDAVADATVRANEPRVCRTCKHWRPSSSPGPHIKIERIPAGVRVQMWKRNPHGYNDEDGFATLLEPARRVTLDSGLGTFEATVEHNGRRFVHQFSGASDWEPFWSLPEAVGLEREGECENVEIGDDARGAVPYVHTDYGASFVTRESFGCNQWESKP